MSFPIATPTAAQDAFAGYSAYEEAGFDLEVMGFDASTLDEQSINFFVPSQEYSSHITSDKQDDEFHWMGLIQESSCAVPTDLSLLPSSDLDFSTGDLPLNFPTSFETINGAALGDFPVSPQATWSPSSQMELSPVLSIGGLSPDILDLAAMQSVDETSPLSLSTPLLFSTVLAAGLEQYNVPSTTVQLVSSPNSHLHTTVERTESSTDAPYRCGFGSCGYTSSKIYNVKRHRSTTHEKTRAGFKCSFCPKVMGRKDNINQHMRNCRLRPAGDRTNASSAAPTASQAVAF